MASDLESMRSGVWADSIDALFNLLPRPWLKLDLFMSLHGVRGREREIETSEVKLTRNIELILPRKWVNKCLQISPSRSGVGRLLKVILVIQSQARPMVSNGTNTGLNSFA